MLYLRETRQFFIDIIAMRTVITELVKRDFMTRYVTSSLGIVWAFAQPIIEIALLTIIFQYIFHRPELDGIPFSLWIIAGLIPWYFLSQSLKAATGSVLEYNYLVKKVVFRVSILPIVKIFSQLLIHTIFLVLYCILFLALQQSPSIFILQVPYYLLAGVLLLLGTSWLTAAVAVFVRDVKQLIEVATRIFFWATPIIWLDTQLPTPLNILLKLNPMYYIINGYRESFLTHTWFWEHPVWTTSFWIFVILLLGIGSIVFMKLRPHFADVV